MYKVKATPGGKGWCLDVHEVIRLIRRTAKQRWRWRAKALKPPFPEPDWDTFPLEIKQTFDGVLAHGESNVFVALCPLNLPDFCDMPPSSPDWVFPLMLVEDKENVNMIKSSMEHSNAQLRLLRQANDTPAIPVFEDDDGTHNLCPPAPLFVVDVPHLLP
jgi:hypothetical protein